MYNILLLADDCSDIISRIEKCKQFAYNAYIFKRDSDFSTTKFRGPYFNFEVCKFKIVTVPYTEVAQTSMSFHICSPHIAE